MSTMEPTERPPGFMENRQMGLGRAPGIDLHAIYNSHKPKALKTKRLKKVLPPMKSEFSKAIQNF